MEYWYGITRNIDVLLGRMAYGKTNKKAMGLLPPGASCFEKYCIEQIAYQL